MTIREALESSLPDVFARTEVGRLTGGIIQPGTCANCDSMGTGVPGRFKVNRKVCYSKRLFIEWVLSRAE